MKKIISVALAAFMLVCAVPFAAFAASGVLNPNAFSLPFVDVSADDYFFEPVIWAYAEGVTTGTTATKFAPSSTCTRAQVVTFIWRAMGEPEPDTVSSKFEDVKPADYFYKAVLWAIEQGITEGTSAKRFSPDVTCTNAHIITFIWRAMGEPDKTGEGEWWDDSVNWAKSSGLLDGTYTGDFDVKKGCPRANVVTYLFRHIERDTTMVYVSANAGAAACDGSAKKPYGTIAAARDALRKMSGRGKAKVIISDGTYNVTKTVVFTAEDGNADYIGTDGAVITGGITFTSKDFAPASGAAVKYFDEADKANIVQIDLKQFGYTKDDIASIYKDPATGSLVHNINGHIPTLYAGGEMATICRYPNGEYAKIDSGKINTSDGFRNARDYLDTTTVQVADEFAAEMATWHDLSKVFVRGRFNCLWCEDNSRVVSLNGKALTVYFAGGYDPRDGMFFYCQNAPEMLDAPGEYYVDDDAILYYYKDADFDGESFTIPRTATLIEVKGADSLALRGLTLESASGDIIKADADHFTMKGCEVRDSGEWVRVSGSDNLVEDCYFHDFSNGILIITGGDCKELIPANSVVTNNEFTNWGILGRVYNEAVRIDSACGITLSHNEMHDAPHMAIGWTGNNNIIEYNEVYDVCNDTDDAGAIYSYNSYAHYGNVFRYNYVHDIRAKDKVIMNVKNYPYCHVSGLYWDGGKSGQTAEYNIFENISGAGVIASGRDEVVTNNLFISCGYGVSMECCYYGGIFANNGFGGGGGKSNQGFSGMENNTVWQKAFPILYKLKWEDSDRDPDDPLYYVAPAGNVLKDNYFYFDKANVKSMASYGHLFQNVINEAVYKFSGENIVDAEEGVNQTTYTSKRTPITARDVIEETSKVTGITMEEFLKIGRIK